MPTEMQELEAKLKAYEERFGPLLPPAPPAFEKDDLVAWNHAEATQHAVGSVLRRSALRDGTPVGKVVGPANEEKTHWVVWFSDKELSKENTVRAVGTDPVEAAETHPNKNTFVLTADELVKVAEE